MNSLKVLKSEVEVLRKSGDVENWAAKVARTQKQIVQNRSQFWSQTKAAGLKKLENARSALAHLQLSWSNY